MNVKHGTTLANVLALPLLRFLEAAASTFVVAQTIFFLKDRVFFKKVETSDAEMG
jgi:hypothetical protein